jgi:hypothetical protein
MARIARVIAKGYPHHVTQCGNRRARRAQGKLYTVPESDIKFVLCLEDLLDRRLMPGKPGGPPKKRK